MVILAAMPLLARLRATHPDKIIPWAAGLTVVLVLVAICGSLIGLGLAQDEAVADERTALVGPEIHLVDPTVITSPPGYADLLTGCHDGVRVFVTANGSRTGAGVAAVLDERCPR